MDFINRIPLLSKLCHFKVIKGDKVLHYLPTKFSSYVQKVISNVRVCLGPQGTVLEMVVAVQGRWWGLSGGAS